MLRIATLLLVAAISTAQAQTENIKTVIEPGTGGVSCGKWTNTPKRSPQHEIYRQWVVGFVSGVNFENAEGDFLRNTDSDALTPWIDNYCRQNPLHHITQAMIELVKVLKAETPLTPVPIPPPRPQ
jgi:hypothetical protein